MGRLSTLELREMSVTDLIEVVALESANQPSPWSEGVFRDELSTDNRTYVVACLQEVVAFGGVMVVGSEAHITNLLVAPDHREAGIGRSIVAWLIRHAVEGGAQHLTLEVRASNEAARNLYSSFGMAPVGLRPGYYGAEDALILWGHDIANPEYLERLA